MTYVVPLMSINWYFMVFRNQYFCPVVDLCDFVTACPGKVCKPPVCPFPGYTNAGQPFRMVHVCHSNWGSLHAAYDNLLLLSGILDFFLELFFV